MMGKLKKHIMVSAEDEVLNIDKKDIEQYLSEVKEAARNDRYRLDRNAKGQDNINLFLDYVIDEARAKEIILSLTAMDFSDILQNEHKEEVAIMTEKGRRDFCIECRKETEYLLQKKDIVKTIRDKEYTFGITVAVCAECGEEMSIPGLIDKNVREIDEQYRAVEGLVSMEDIERLMKIYKIGKAPLSLALGFGEVTIPRYLEGQVPSKEYSDIVKAALASPAYMKKKLMENRDKLTDAAYKKAMAEADSIESLFSVSDKMLRVIAYVFEKLEEVTPLMLQKLLYFIQGVYSALYGKFIFAEDCRAWVHGPVYPEVYDLFRDFKYNPIDDARFALLEGNEDVLTDDEKKVINLVVNTFGMYGGKVLEKITHNEEPWMEARKGYGDSIPSSELLIKDRIMKYYIAVNQKYGIDTEAGLRTYIHDMLAKA